MSQKENIYLYYICCAVKINADADANEGVDGGKIRKKYFFKATIKKILNGKSEVDYAAKIFVINSNRKCCR